MVSKKALNKWVLCSVWGLWLFFFPGSKLQSVMYKFQSSWEQTILLCFYFRLILSSFGNCFSPTGEILWNPVQLRWWTRWGKDFQLPSGEVTCCHKESWRKEFPYFLSGKADIVFNNCFILFFFSNDLRPSGKANIKIIKLYEKILRRDPYSVTPKNLAGYGGKWRYLPNITCFWNFGSIFWN